MSQGPEVFLSYAREDEARVAEVYRLLKSKGFRPWMDTQDIAGGEDWQLAIKRALRRAKFVLVFLSRFSFRKPGVLQDEIQTAVSVREANLESERFLIPVRLEECDVPDSLKAYQWINYFERDGPARLLKALGYQSSKRWMFAAIALVLAALVGSVWVGRGARPDRIEQFVSGRDRKENDRDTPFGLIGVTLLQLRPTLTTDVPLVREIIHPSTNSDVPAEHLTPVRSRLKLSLPLSAKFRIAIESSRTGYLYVVDRARYGNELTPPVMIFPTTKIRSGDNLISRGSYVELPSDYWAFQSRNADYRGEQITILLAPASLPVSIGSEEVTLDSGLFQKWERDWLVPARLVATQLEDSEITATPGEAAAKNHAGRALSSQDPPPQYLYEVPLKANTPVMFHFSVSVQ